MNKKQLRAEMKSIRSNLSSQRKKEAKNDLFSAFCARLKPYRRVLSFSSIFDEICLQDLNSYLCQNNKLCLLTLEGAIYQVDHLFETRTNAKGWIEPNPCMCEGLSLDQIDCVLVPGLAFDLDCNRLGYGKGVYDRLLSKRNLTSIGIGFKEQLVAKVPTESHDQKVHEILLF